MFEVPSNLFPGFHLYPTPLVFSLPDSFPLEFCCCVLYRQTKVQRKQKKKKIASL